MALSFEDLELLLRAWGRAYGVARLAEVSERMQRGPLGGYGDHPLERGRQFAPGKKRQAYRPAPRDGSSRRRFMASKHGVDAQGRPLLAIVPIDYVDPVPCHESRRGGGVSGPVSVSASPELRRVHAASLDLMMFDPLRGKVLRAEYCEEGRNQALKASRLVDQHGAPLKVNRYRDELYAARVWMHGRLA